MPRPKEHTAAACSTAGAPRQSQGTLPEARHFGVASFPLLHAYVGPGASAAPAPNPKKPSHEAGHCQQLQVSSISTVLQRETSTSCSSDPEVPDPLSHCQLRFNPLKVIGSWVYF